MVVNLLHNMDTKTSSQLLDEISVITRKNLALIEENFNSLTDTQLSWRKDKNSWNINEIFAHLNEYARYYHKTIAEKIKNTRYREPREAFISSPLGRSAWKSMKLGNAKNVKRRMKTPRLYNPLFHPELLNGKDLQTFTDGQQLLLQIIKEASNVNLRRVRIPISISKIIRLRLGDALLFVVYHNERHVQQALNVINHERFPSRS